MSHSAGQDLATPGFDDHRGYEADLLTTLEAMEGIDLSFRRRGVAAWEDNWLLPTGPDHDMAGGGITVLHTRTRDAAGKWALVFTAGHIRFRQSLLVRAEDAKRLSRYEDLDGTVGVGVIAGTTGEARLLELTGLADADGILSPGVRIDTPRGTVVADGGAGYRIAAQVLVSARSGEGTLPLNGRLTSSETPSRGRGSRRSEATGRSENDPQRYRSGDPHHRPSELGQWLTRKRH